MIIDTRDFANRLQMLDLPELIKVLEIFEAEEPDAYGAFIKIVEDQMFL